MEKKIHIRFQIQSHDIMVVVIILITVITHLKEPNLEINDGCDEVEINEMNMGMYMETFNTLERHLLTYTKKNFL